MRNAIDNELVVGADGLRSTVAEQVSAARRTWATSPSGTFYTYVADVPLETEGVAYEFHVAPDAFAGIFPTNDGVACVWLGTPSRRLGPLLRPAGGDRVEALLAAITAASPSLGARVRAGRVLDPVRGRADLPNVVRRPVGRLVPGGPGGSGRSWAGWALVGDAGYHRDPVTGHGITDAFRDAELLAGAVDTALRNPECEQDALAGYHARRDAALRQVFSITRDLSAFPDPERFVELQIQLSDALEREAQALAALPFPAAAVAA